jgi:hypothetical protein
MNRKTGIILVIIICVFVTAGFWLRNQFRIDSCLDQGGRWNYEAGECEFRALK